MAKAIEFEVVNDQTGETQKTDLEGFEGELQMQGYRVASRDRYDAALAERNGPPPPVFDPGNRMAMQTYADAAAIGLAAGEGGQDEANAKKAMKETDYEGRQEAVKNSSVSLNPGQVVARRNAARNASEAGIDPTGVVERRPMELVKAEEEARANAKADAAKSEPKS